MARWAGNVRTCLCYSLTCDWQSLSDSVHAHVVWHAQSGLCSHADGHIHCFVRLFCCIRSPLENVSGSPNRNRNLYFLTNMTMDQRARAIRAGWVSSLLTGLPLRTWFQPWHRDRSHQQHTASFSSLGLFGMNWFNLFGTTTDAIWWFEMRARGGKKRNQKSEVRGQRDSTLPVFLQLVVWRSERHRRNMRQCNGSTRAQGIPRMKFKRVKKVQTKWKAPRLMAI